MVPSTIARFAAVIVMAQGTALWGGQSRERFLEEIDQALALRDTKSIMALSDVRSWSAAGYPTLGELQLRLPAGPISRIRDLSENSVLYQDARKRSWRLTITRGSEGQPLAVIRSDACPHPDRRQGVYQSDDKVRSWTVLECWPLPM